MSLTGTGSGLTPDDQREASFTAFLGSVRNLLLVIGPLLAANGWASSSGLSFWIQFTTGSIMTIGPLVYTVIHSFTALVTKRKTDAVAVQAGINLTLSKAAIAADGKTIVSLDDGSATPPKPVTIETGQEIIKNFGPAITEVQTTEELNAGQLRKGTGS